MRAQTIRRLLQPSVLILVAANLVPLVGVIAWGWDAFLLLMLYWMETAVIAFWTVVRIAGLPPRAVSGLGFDSGQRTLTPVGLALVVAANAAMFMGIHFVFLWQLFGGEWPHHVHSLADFDDQVVIASGLWIPLVVLFVGRGVLMLLEVMAPSLRRLFRLPPPPPRPAMLGEAEAVLVGLYARVFVMQVTIILGAWLALVVGTAGAYALLIVVKTAVDVAFETCGDAIETAWRKAKDKVERV